MTEQNYSGSCHCGAVTFQATMNLQGLISCNCSICKRKGTVLGFIPAEYFKLEKGENNLTDYQFGSKRIHHLFCKICGVTGFAKGANPDGSEMVAVNVRCLEGVDVDTLEVNQYDGKSL